MPNVRNKWQIMREREPERYAAHMAPDAIAARKRAKISEHQKKKLEWLRKFKTDAGCCDCGEKDFRCLDFDHRDGVEKRDSLANIARSLGWSAIYDEIQKCDVRCSNCHRKRTHDKWTDGDGYPPVTGVDY